MTRTVGQWAEHASRTLGEAGLPEAAVEAKHLVGRVLGVAAPRLALDWHQNVGLRSERRLGRALRLRARRQPLAYVTSEAWFWRFESPLKVDRRVLIPRPETEGLIEAALRWIGAQPEAVVVADIGTGSGCIALALAGVPNVRRILAVDISPAALSVARENARRLGLSKRIDWRRGSLLAPLRRTGARIDLIVANLPYVKGRDFMKLEPEVRREPRLALFGGTDGLRLIDRLIRQAPSVLRPGGALMLEIGRGQSRAVRRTLESQGSWSGIQVEKDLAGIDRVITARAAA